MREIVLKAGSGNSRIVIGNVLPNLSSLVSADNLLMVVDKKVSELYGTKFPDWPVLQVEGGEGTKTLKTVEWLYSEFMRRGLDKSSCVVGVGGGTVCDLVGYAASTYLRGLRLALVPTTLLAQVDAAIGGKNGVNFGGFKNQVGTIRQPELVACDPLFINSLPISEVKSGLAEIIKSALIADADLYEYLLKSHLGVLDLNMETLLRVIGAAISVKVKIVSADEAERGERVKLNFGHTVGHAVEIVKHISHGEAVSVGMVVDMALSRSKCGFSRSQEEAVIKLLTLCGLPIAVDCEPESLVAPIMHDKKRSGVGVRMALLEAPGISKLEIVDVSEIKQACHDLCKRC